MKVQQFITIQPCTDSAIDNIPNSPQATVVVIYTSEIAATPTHTANMRIVYYDTQIVYIAIR